MTATETSAVAWGGTQLPYTIRRSARRKKTVAVTVDRCGAVLLVAPEHLTTDELDGIVSRKAEWIVRRLRHAQSHGPPLAPREFVSGESVLYLGRHYRLKVHPYSTGGTGKTGETGKTDAIEKQGESRTTGVSEKTGEIGVTRKTQDTGKTGESGDAKLRGGWLHVPAPAGERQAAEVREKVVAWLRRRAAERLPERVAAWRPKAGVPMPRVIVSDQRKRWGSCDRNGTIRLNWRIIQAPMRLVDYVVVHELVHLRHRGHGRDFWQAVGRVMPDYERRREDLRRCGVGLAW